MRLARRLFSLLGLGMALACFQLGPGHAQSPAKVGLVVGYADGTTETRCIDYTTNMSGFDLLQASGLPMIYAFDAMGPTICKIRDNGCPADDCFCQSTSSGYYWSYWHLGSGSTSQWNYSVLGAGLYKPQPGSVEGWYWGKTNISQPGQTMTLPVVPFEQICAAAPAATETPTPTLTPTPTSSPTTLPPTATAYVPQLAPSETPVPPTPVPTDPPLPTATLTAIPPAVNQFGEVMPTLPPVLPTTTAPPTLPPPAPLPTLTSTRPPLPTITLPAPTAAPAALPVAYPAPLDSAATQLAMLPSPVAPSATMASQPYPAPPQMTMPVSTKPGFKKFVTKTPSGGSKIKTPGLQTSPTATLTPASDPQNGEKDRPAAGYYWLFILLVIGLSAGRAGLIHRRS